MHTEAKQNTCSLGVDVGGSAVKAALVDTFGMAICHAKRPTRVSGQEAFLGELVDLVSEMTRHAARKGLAVSAIGIGVPGLVRDNCIIDGINNLPFLLGSSLSGLLASHFDCPVSVDNDAFYMASAESRYGAASGATDVLFLTVGTGIGGAVMLDGRFYRGGRGFGAEMGHMLVQCDEREGRYRTFESLASTSALVARYRHLTGDPRATGERLVQAYLAGISHAREVMEWHFQHLSAGIASLVNIFNPHLVVLGGGIAEAGDFYVDQVRQRVLTMAIKETIDGVSLVGTRLGNLAGCIGAAYSASLASRPRTAVHSL